MEIDLGFSIETKLDQGVILVASLIDQNVKSSQFHHFRFGNFVNQNLSFGLEIGFFGTLFFQAGYTSQAPTAGLELYYHKHTLGVSLSQTPTLVTGPETIYSFQYAVRVF
jgi:hypothetical protein